MKITVLGYQSPAPGPGGAGPGYLLETDKGAILLDCGSAVYSRLMQYLPIEKLTAVIMSHYHHDHVCDIPILQYGVMMATIQKKMDTVFPIYGPTQPAEWAERMKYEKYTDLIPFNADSELEIAGVKVTFLRTDHSVECYAMKITDGIHTIVYGADSGPETIWGSFVNDCDLFICEGTFTTPLAPSANLGHLTAREAAQLAAQSNAKQLLITHLSPDIARKEYESDAAAHYHGLWSLAEIGKVIAW
ncbi:MBL fold metallo-hydrolase [Aneurinibacillus terranovensis]|uniref:MBL fold metallo-hydrolase n=1 Tax=Aneurinibacillus terranovensis TaxID=278991 RepID=UPI000427BAFD|nr:MBL fold metallo-hydrolase [Aneurinibacillus terranovensis]